MKYSGVVIKNIIYMIAYTYEQVNLIEYQNKGSETFDNVWNYYADILIITIDRLVRRGIPREYSREYENKQTVKGKILVSKTIKERGKRSGGIVCSAESLNVNNKNNKLIKLALYTLYTHPKVTLLQKNKLKDLLYNFSGVDLISVKELDHTYLRTNSRDDNYKMILSVSLLVLNESISNSSFGIYDGFNILIDKMIHKIYEDFVYSIYKKETNYLISKPIIEWKLVSGADDFLPKMKTDILIESKERIIIIDTKFYRKNMAENFNKQKHHTSNLYQMYSYLGNYDNCKRKILSGVILYAKTEDEIQPDSKYYFSGNELIVTHLDLNQSFDDIKKDIISVLDL